MIGIFIEPNYQIKKFIKKWKSYIKKKKIKSKLTNHPPHSTLYLANLDNPKQVIFQIEKIVKKFKKFEIKVNKTDVFVDDKLIGGDTIYLNIKKNKNLYLLQKRLAQNLKFFLNKKTKKNFKLKFLNKRLANSQKNFGFPFVGSHWMPHFTISSIKDFTQTNEFKKFKESKINFDCKINKISIWKISGEKHYKIKELKLKSN